jgi:hypothetical protein
MKLANGIYGTILPDQLRGRYQMPDFVWSITHQLDGECNTVAISPMKAWCPCAGEGKPDETEAAALNQVMMAGAACAYHQISVGEAEPRVLLFTINMTSVRFFLMTATTKPQSNLDNPKWSLNCRPMDFELDLCNLRDCFQLRAFTRALAHRNDLVSQHMHALLSQRGSNQVTTWWIEPKNTSTVSVGDLSCHDLTPTSSQCNSGDCRKNETQLSSASGAGKHIKLGVHIRRAMAWLGNIWKS